MKTVEYNGYKIISKDGISRPCVLALGNFDGVHIAHRELLASAKRLAHELGDICAGVWCFDENTFPRKTGSQPCHITPLEQKTEMFFELGMDCAVISDFSCMRDTLPEHFIRDHLMQKLGCVGAVCGYNFRFGNDRLGDPELLRKYLGDKLIVVPRIELDGEAVSSTRIRELLRNGDIERANILLGRPFCIISDVSHGKMLGRTLGFPTANQTLPEGYIYPRAGVYATACTLPDGKIYPAVSNVGIRPTVSDSHAVNCETYILDFCGDIYGKPLKVEFFKRLRDEKKFSSVDELKCAIAHDAQSARMTFRKEAK